MKIIFPIIDNLYDLRNQTNFNSRNVPTIRYGIETASFAASRIWGSVLRSYKECSSINEFKQKLSFDIQETAHANFQKNISIKQVTHRTGYLSLVDAFIIYKNLFRDHKAEVNMFGNTFQ